MYWTSDGSFFRIAVFLVVYADRGNLELILQRVMEMAGKKVVQENY
jgi:hypothetical protein